MVEALRDVAERHDKSLDTVEPPDTPPDIVMPQDSIRHAEESEHPDAQPMG